MKECIQGIIEYPNKRLLRRAIDILTTNGFLRNGKFVDSNGELYDILDGQIIKIPRSFHYHFIEILEDLVNGAKGLVVFSSKDICFYGGFWIDGEVYIVENLIEWAKENIEGDNSIMPQITTDPPTLEEAGAQMIWMTMVQEIFTDKMFDLANKYAVAKNS